MRRRWQRGYQVTLVRESRRDQLIVVALFVTVIVALSYGYGSPMRTAALLATVVGLTLTVWNKREDMALGAIGIIAGPLIELAATASGLWQYTSPTFARLPLWVIPMWWIYSVTVARLIRSLTGEPIAARSTVMAAGLITVEVPWLCAFGVSRPLVALTGVIVLLALFLSRHRTPNDAIALIVCGLIGPAAELIPVQMRAWIYPAGPLFGLPLWLPAGYGVFGAALIHLGVALGRRGAEGAHATRDDMAHHSFSALRELHDAKTKQRVAGWQP